MALTALLLCLTAAGVQAQGQPQPNSRANSAPPAQGMKPTEEMQVFPYQLANYTSLAHEVRIKNAPVVVVGKVETYSQIEGTEKSRNWSIWLRVETFLRTDRPGQEKAERIYLRTLPLLPPYKDIEVGDRCLLLLDRDLRFDNALVLPSEMHYYPVSEEGVVSKFWKEQPTKDDPVIREQALSSFLEEVRGYLREISLEEQTRNSDLVITGTVTDSRQGTGQSHDFYYIQIKPDKIYKGQFEGETVNFIQRGNPYRWAVKALNRSSFKEGDRVLCFGNKDPTFSKPGPWNPKGEPMWVFPHQKNSTLFLATRTAWRRGVRPIPHAELFADLERWTESQD
jgi:hypothetical protein